MACHTARKQPVLGVGDNLGAGDSYLVVDILPPELEEEAFETLVEEVEWCTMYHRGGEVPRLVAVQGQVGEDGSFPVYRHPADESPPLKPFSRTVAQIRECVQAVLKHPVNHVLIQHYRSGNDYISEHSDKTIDVVKGSSIVNVSLGAQRTMTLRTKKPQYAKHPPLDAAESPKSELNRRETQRIPLLHNSMFVMGLDTNKKWLHGVNRDNRPVKTKSDAERLYGGGRISLTFRHIGTLLNYNESTIWGQGAIGKTKEAARNVLNGTEEAEKLIIAFGNENHQNDFDWDREYGAGYDVLHFSPK